MKQNKGFTLLELMIVVAIIGILSMVALPAYQENVAASKRADAKASLSSFAGLMERYYTENNSYTGATVANTWGSPATLPKDGNSPAYYTLSISALAATSYTLTATAAGSMSGDRCGNFTLTSTGVKGVSTAETDCW